MPEQLAAALRLIVDEAADAAVADLCEQDAEAIANTLARWGRFTSPVHIRTTEDRAELRASAGAATAGLLCGLATLDTVTLLAPHRWVTQPSRRALEQSLVHELAHVLLYQRCVTATAWRRPRLPTWLREGMAVFVAEGPPAPSSRRDLAGHPDPAALARARPDTVAAPPDLCYTAAVVAFAAWLERFGERRLPALCRNMRGGHSFARAHTLACGVTEDDFLQRWSDALKAEAERT